MQRDACQVHSPFVLVHLTHQNLSAHALFCLNSLAKVNTQLLIYDYSFFFHSYTLECNYNTGRFMNSLAPATMDDGRATPPPVAGFPPKYTIAHYEDVSSPGKVPGLEHLFPNQGANLGFCSRGNLFEIWRNFFFCCLEV